MNNSYIKFTDPDTRTKRINVSWWKKIIQTLLKAYFPTGNPNFENEFDNVKQWLLEFKNGNEFPNREIGLNILQKPIMIMPWRYNYGYWIDNNLLLKDFKSTFNAIEITKEEFENHWTEFEQQNEDT